jgi:hypothetical protein
MSCTDPGRLRTSPEIGASQEGCSIEVYVSDNLLMFTKWGHATAGLHTKSPPQQGIVIGNHMHTFCSCVDVPAVLQLLNRLAVDTEAMTLTWIVTISRDERTCRFCMKSLPDWREGMPRLPRADPIMVLNYGGETYAIRGDSSEISLPLSFSLEISLPARSQNVCNIHLQVKMHKNT